MICLDPVCTFQPLLCNKIFKMVDINQIMISNQSLLNIKLCAKHSRDYVLSLMKVCERLCSIPPLHPPSLAIISSGLSGVLNAKFKVVYQSYLPPNYLRKFPPPFPSTNNILNTITEIAVTLS